MDWKEFYAKWTPIFERSDRREPIKMFGCECGAGWIDIIDRALDKCLAEDPDFRVFQIKEKFGTMRLYAAGGGDVQKICTEAEEESETTCEQCGAPGVLRGGGWLYTACDGCEAKRSK
jgi:hypothetical protein